MLFAVPSRDLLEQTYRAARAAGRGGPGGGLVQPPRRGADRDGGPGVQVTTDPRRLAELVRFYRVVGQSYTVLTTYASVETIIAAHKLRADRDGVAALPQWDLLVADEAHHTETSKQWGRINSHRLVPAVHRLAMTATPRLMGAVSRDARGRRVAAAAVRMSEKLHGPVAYRMGLSQAQRLGKLARSQVVVAEVDEARLRDLVAERGRGDEVVQAELQASAVGATLRAAGKFGCRRLLTYHRTVAGAVAAAEAMAEQSWLLHAQGTTAPQRVFAVALHEAVPATERARALDALAAGTDLDGNEVDLVVVCSVRVLNEGIDVPAVEAVALIEPRRAQHELLQIAGRALRFDRGNPEKTASIIVPVLHLEGPADEEMASADWDPVTNVLRAVESYEPDGGAEATQSTSRTPHSVLTDAEERRRQQERARELTQMLQLTRERSQRAVVDWLRITVVGDPTSGDLEKVMQAATAYQSQHGNLKVPAGWEEDGIRLAVELDKLRRKARADKNDLARLIEESIDEATARSTWMEHGPRVHPDLVQYLSDLGFEWEPRTNGRALLLAAARAYTQMHGHLLPRLDESIDVDGEEVALGALLAERRRPGITDTELDEIGVWRVPEGVPWTAAFHRQLVRLGRFKEEGGRRAELLHGSRVYLGEDLGKWLCEQHVRWKELHEQQRAVLEELRMGPAARDARVTSAVPRARRGRKERLMEVVIAAQQHLDEAGPLVDEAGQLRVTADYRTEVEGREVQLKKRLYAVRARYDSYPPELQNLFAGLGLPWAKTPGADGGVDDLARANCTDL
ncbi:helicase associated domain-containing protein [Streptomyces sp. A1-5]|uniref:helicase associated domain-containing protein n=1 Tax=Streptomyces sp. A1-5 TaxID=2738410 RepID=UPI001F48C3F1|nr:helicase associated domain-containing protein [Streptomyces sp. A1-5]UJB46277.1 DEAD/DEAH box helicase family protein [Streptomyces sp. A1-5]